MANRPTMEIMDPNHEGQFAMPAFLAVSNKKIFELLKELRGDLTPPAVASEHILP